MIHKSNISVKNIFKRRIAAAIAAGAGVVTIAEGSGVLLGVVEPPYTVLLWLLIYNVTTGGIALAAGIGLWLSRSWAAHLSSGIAGAHSLILMILWLLPLLGTTVAGQSLHAMMVRSGLWIVLAWAARKTGEDIRTPSTTLQENTQP